MKHYILLCFFLLLMACAAPNTHYYYLPNSSFIPPMELKQPIVVEVNLANYLSSPSLVVEADSYGFNHLTSYHLWADDLIKSIRNNITNKLNQLGLAEKQFFSIESNEKYFSKLEIFIDKFQGNLNGTVEVVGNVKFIDKYGVIKNAAFFQEVVPQTKNGYSGMIEALDHALSKVSLKIYQVVQGKNDYVNHSSNRSQKWTVCAFKTRFNGKNHCFFRPACKNGKTLVATRRKTLTFG